VVAQISSVIKRKVSIWWTQEHPELHSHAERGNEISQKPTPKSPLAPLKGGLHLVPKLQFGNSIALFPNFRIRVNLRREAYEIPPFEGGMLRAVSMYKQHPFTSPWPPSKGELAPKIAKLVAYANNSGRMPGNWSFRRQLCSQTEFGNKIVKKPTIESNKAGIFCRSKIVCLLIFTIFLLYACNAFAQQTWSSGKFIIARVKYNGGGDWYNDPSILPNMLNFLAQNTSINCGAEERYVELTDDALFSYPVIFLTGHGQIAFSEEEAKRLKLYLESGGFLYADDDYGMDRYFRREMKKVFPSKSWVELPFSHEIYHSLYKFPNGIPKIHEHDGGPGKAFGLFHEGRMVAFYTFNTNISDGWADPNVHQDPEPVRQMALKMGANIIVYALMR
jgi:hypothetical protein